MQARARVLEGGRRDSLPLRYATMDRGPFDPPTGRQTSVVLARNVATGDHRLVTSIATRQAVCPGLEHTPGVCWGWGRRGGGRGSRLSSRSCSTRRRRRVGHARACGARRKTTEVLRVNLRTGRLELENDAVAESTYEGEVGWRDGARCWQRLLARSPPSHPPTHPRRPERGAQPLGRGGARSGGAGVGAAGVRGGGRHRRRAPRHAREGQGGAARRARGVLGRRQPVDAGAAAGGVHAAGELWALLAPRRRRAPAAPRRTRQLTRRQQRCWQACPPRAATPTFGARCSSTR